MKLAISFVPESVKVSVSKHLAEYLHVFHSVSENCALWGFMASEFVGTLFFPRLLSWSSASSTMTLATFVSLPEFFHHVQ